MAQTHPDDERLIRSRAGAVGALMVTVGAVALIDTLLSLGLGSTRVNAYTLCLVIGAGIMLGGRMWRSVGVWFLIISIGLTVITGVMMAGEALGRGPGVEWHAWGGVLENPAGWVNAGLAAFVVVTFAVQIWMLMVLCSSDARVYFERASE